MPRKYKVKEMARIVELYEDHLDPIDGYPTLAPDNLAERLGLATATVQAVLNAHSKAYRKFREDGNIHQSSMSLTTHRQAETRRREKRNRR